MWLVEKHERHRQVGWMTTVEQSPLATSYRSLREASELIEVRHQLPARSVDTHQYTQAAPGSGWVLACALTAVRKVDVPLPAEIKLHRCGWTNLTAHPFTDYRNAGLIP